MTTRKALTSERKFIIARNLYRTFTCRKCCHHMVELMETDLCRQCYEMGNMKRKCRKRVHQKPLYALSGVAKQARIDLELTVPGDGGNQLVPHIQNLVVTAPRTTKALQPHVEEYLKGLVVILVDPINSYTRAQMADIKRELLKRGVKFYSTTNYDKDSSIEKKKVLLAGRSKYDTPMRGELNALSEKFGCPVVDINDFLNSIRSGRCAGIHSAMSVSQTRKGDRLLWENPFRLENPPIVPFKNLKIVDESEFANIPFFK